MWRHAIGGAAIQQAGRGAQAAVPGKRTQVELEQRTDAPDAVHAAAERGVATPAGPLPFGQSIQRLFGRHDISGIQAHTGGAADASARAMGATAYATGNHVVLGGTPDLHTVAHEAAHVVQQRAGVQLKGGVGAVGDPHEQHADAVADRVVRGESAEPLLDRYHGIGGSGGAPAVQRVWAETREIEGHEERRWEQGEKEEVRANGWYHQVEGRWQPVGSNAKAKRKLSPERDQPKQESVKKPKRDPKISLAKSSTVKAGLELVEDSEIGAEILRRALEVSPKLELLLSEGRTQTRMDYGGDRGKDTIELAKGRMVVGGAGSVAQQLVMELCNLANKIRFWETDYAAQNGELEQEAYVQLNEKIEYEATLLVYQAWSAAQGTSQEGAWGKSNHKKPELLESWELWWDHMQKHNQPHLKIYRDGWTSLRTATKRLPAPPSRAPEQQEKTTSTELPEKTTQPSSLSSLLGYGSDEEVTDDPSPTTGWKLDGYDEDDEQPTEVATGVKKTED